MQRLNGTCYVSAKGGLNYLRHEQFGQANIEVRYVDYSLTEYEQVGKFTPYVSALDAIAHLGRRALSLVSPKTTHWRNALASQESLGRSSS